MKEPKKKIVRFWDGEDEYGIRKVEYISVKHLKEWIDEQSDKRRVDLGTNFTLSQLEKFIDEP